MPHIRPSKAALGYLFIALCSFFFGALVSITHDATFIGNSQNTSVAAYTIFKELHGAISSPDVLMSMGAFLGIMYFFVYARQAALDDKKNAYPTNAPPADKITLLKYGFFGIPSGILIWFVAVTRLTNFSPEVLRELAAITSIGAPTWLWIAVTLKLLSSKEKDVRDNAFRFANRVYFPALFCTTSSFMFGWWTLTDGGLSLVLVAIALQGILAAIYIWEYWRGGLAKPLATVRVNLLVFACLIMAVPLSPVLADNSWLQAVTFALVFSFAIGVSEVASRIYAHALGDRYEVCDEGVEYYISGANWATLILIPSVPILSLINPVLPAWFLATYSATHLVWWIYTKDHRTKSSSWIAVGFGFAMIVWIILATFLGYSGRIPSLLVNQFSIGNGYSLVSALVLFSAAMLASDAKNFGKLFKQNDPFKNKKAALFLFVAVAVLFILFTALLSSASERLSSESISSVLIQARIWEMQQIMVLLVVVSTVTYVLQYGFSDNDGTPPDTNDMNTAPESSVASPATQGSTSPTSPHRSIRTALAFLELGRPLISSIAGLSHGAILFFGASQSLEKSVIAATLLTLITMFGFIINDIFDFRKDYSGGRFDKQLVSGYIKLNDAWTAATLSLLAIIAISIQSFNAATLTAVIVLMASLIFYSQFSRLLPLMKGLYTAGLCLSPIIIAEVIIERSLVSIDIYLFGLVFFTGRELFLDVLDLHSDKRSGMKTLASILGHSVSMRVAWVLMIGAFVFAALGETGVMLAVCIASVLTLFVLWFVAKHDIVRASNWASLHLFYGLAVVIISIS